MISSDDLQVFLAALRAGSLAAAATALGVDRTTVGRRLEALERQLRAPLFVRARGGLTATSGAQELRAVAERILGELHALETASLASERAVRGVVRLATSEGLATFIARSCVFELVRRYPELELELLAQNRPVDLTRGEADLALRPALTREKAVLVRRLTAMPIALFGAESYVRRHPSPTALSGLAGHTLLLPTGELSRLPEARLLSKLPGTRVGLRSTSLPVLVEAAVAGLGLIPLVEAWARHVGLLCVLPLPDIPPRSMWLAVPQAQRQRPAVRAVMDAVIQAVGREAASP